MSSRCSAAVARIWTLDDGTPAPVLQASAGRFGHRDVAPSQIQDGHALVGQVAAARLPLVTNDLPGDARLRAEAWARQAGLVAFAGYPLLVEDRVVGVLELFARHPLAAETLDATAAEADVIALGIERKRAEEALRQSEDRLRALIQNSSDVTALLAPDGTIRYVSPAAERLLGYQPAALVGRNHEEFIHPDDVAEVRSALARVLADPAAAPAIEFRVRHQDGSWRWLEETVANRLDDPAVGGVVVNCRDISERRALAAAVGQAAASAQSDALKSALLTAVSHELRTPLATIKTSVTALLSPAVAWDPEDHSAFLRDIDAETDRLDLVVGNLLDLSRIEGGVLRPRLAWHDIAELLAAMGDWVTVQAAGHPVTMAVVPQLPLVRCDYVQIAQVLRNLGENALRYTPPGTPIELSARAVPGAVEVSVADRGPGIPPHDLPQVFEPFYQGERAGQGGGIGIGLAICAGLVKAHEGRIWAESGAGEGTTVRFTLPVDATEENPHDDW